MTARHSALDEPFFREWRIARAQGGGTSAVASGNAATTSAAASTAGTPPHPGMPPSAGALPSPGAPLTRSKDRSAQFAKLLGLERTLPVPAMVVVGSKGKGTAVAAASYALHQAGLRVGTVTSPPLRENRERIRTDGQAISAADYARMSALCAATLERMPALDERGYLSPSGLFTLVGTRFLLDAGVGALVIEEGLGGLSDEVSLFDYPVVVLTQIFAEHTDVLGGTLASVAADLVGVVTGATRRVVTHPQQPAEARAALHARLAPNARAEVPAGVGAGNRDVQAGAAGAANSIAEINLELGAAGANALIEECRATPLPGYSTLPESPAQSDSHSALPDAHCAGPNGTSLRSVPQAHPVDAWRAGVLSLPGRASAHEFAGGKWLVDAAISGPGVRAAREFATRYFAQRNIRDWQVLACFPDTKDVQDCLRELRGLPVTAAAAGTDYLSFTALQDYVRRADERRDQAGGELLHAGEVTRNALGGSSTGRESLRAGEVTKPDDERGEASAGSNAGTLADSENKLPSAAEAAARLAGQNVLAVGTMSFVGEILEALDASVDAWW